MAGVAAALWHNSPRVAAREGSELFCIHVLEHPNVERLLGDDFLQLGVLAL